VWVDEMRYLRIRTLMGCFLATAAFILPASAHRPAGASHEPCRRGREIQHEIIYSPRRTVSRFSIDVEACFTGKATVRGRLQRSDLGGQQLDKEKETCTAPEPCKIQLKLEHPVWEKADYSILIEWEGPDGRQDRVDSLSYDTTCISTSLYGECT